MQDGQMTLFADPAHPKEGGLVAVYPGTSKHAEADPAASPISSGGSEERGLGARPFQLIEEGGYFYARGTSDNKGHGRGLGRYPDPPFKDQDTRANAHAEDGADLR